MKPLNPLVLLARALFDLVAILADYVREAIERQSLHDAALGLHLKAWLDQIMPEARRLEHSAVTVHEPMDR